jgi:predicted amidohydrolase
LVSRYDAEPAAVLQVALLQTHPRLGDVAGNVAELGYRLSEVAGADLAVTPELATHGYHIGKLDPPPEGLAAHDPLLTALGRQGPAVVVGLAESHLHHRYNSAAIIDRDRTYIQRKLYLPTYRLWEERKHFRPGTSLRCRDVRGVRLAVLICNDLWQAPLPWLAAHAGAEVLIVIANSAASTMDVPVEASWDLILRHTAVTLQCYVVFVNRSGSEADSRFWGGSRVITPDNGVLVQLGEGPDVAKVDLDLAALRDQRRRWPLLQESRFGLVARETARLASEEM